MLLNLEEEANKLLEKTSHEQEKYHDERKILFILLENEKYRNSELLKEMINLFNRIIELENKNDKYEAIKLSLEKQHIRIKGENVSDDERICLFQITDKEGKKYSFFSRKSARTFMAENSEKFEKDIEIQVVKNENIDLEMLLSEKSEK